MATATTTTTRSKPRPADTCRLTIHIRGVAYGARPTPSEDGRAWRLRKTDGTTHDVRETEHGAECDCPDFIFRRDGIDPLGCKHMRALKALGLIR